MSFKKETPKIDQDAAHIWKKDPKKDEPKKDDDYEEYLKSIGEK